MSKLVFEEVPYEESSLALIDEQYSERAGVAEPEPEPEPAKTSRTKATAD